MRKQQIPAGNYLPPHDAFLRNLVSVLPLGWGPTHSNIITIIADTIISITTITIVRLWALAMAIHYHHSRSPAKIRSNAKAVK